MRNEVRRRRWSRRRDLVMAAALGVALTLGIGSSWTLERYVIVNLAIAADDAPASAPTAPDDSGAG
ncbi:MAG: hypothetical protein EPO52_10965 [Herbiconiux sp.]|uniref:hypothetical protein n=1 Tax=Herbiconiux sp. TaxID=1871186 RepID=UPI0011FD2CC9|nr:hypothetical protein [Herbiconiux sp.]TAJ48625.1 MAG: hypothetical protein EPO52_10965 [Herbiconiux sp.]